MSTKKIVFVCTSNTCRSPMAGGFALKYLQNFRSNGTFIICSRALTSDYEPPGSPASAQGVEIMSESFGIDLRAHRSQLLTTNDVETADFIVGVSKSHSATIISYFPDAVGKIFHLSRDVSDPWHQPKKRYLECAEMMKPLVEEILARLIPDISSFDPKHLLDTSVSTCESAELSQHLTGPHANSPTATSANPTLLALGAHDFIELNETKSE